MLKQRYSDFHGKRLALQSKNCLKRKDVYKCYTDSAMKWLHSEGCFFLFFATHNSCKKCNLQPLVDFCSLVHSQVTAAHAFAAVNMQSYGLFF